MKKALSLISALALLSSATAMTASAEASKDVTYAPPGQTEEIVEGILSGKYCADFNGDGRVDPVDAAIILNYYSECSTNRTPDSWEGEIYVISTNKKNIDRYWINYEYETDDLFEDTYHIFIHLDDATLERVRTLGDLDSDGTVNAKDAVYVLKAYDRSFESGDMDGNNLVDARDASYVLDYYSCLSTSTPVDSRTKEIMTARGDLNGDGYVDARDAAQILKIYAERST